MRGNAFLLMRVVVPVLMTRLYRPGAEGAPYLLSAAMAAGAGGVVLASDM